MMPPIIYLWRSKRWDKELSKRLLFAMPSATPWICKSKHHTYCESLVGFFYFYFYFIKYNLQKSSKAEFADIGYRGFTGTHSVLSVKKRLVLELKILKNIYAHLLRFIKLSSALFDSFTSLVHSVGCHHQSVSLIQSWLQRTHPVKLVRPQLNEAEEHDSSRWLCNSTHVELT